MVWRKDINEVVDEAEAKSKINAAGLINSALEKLWAEAYTSMVNGNYLKWNLKLDAIWMILAGDEIEGGTSDKRVLEIDTKLYSTGNLSQSEGVGFKKIHNPNKSLQYLYLKQKSIYLRRLQNKQGKGTAYINEDEDDID